MRVRKHSDEFADGSPEVILVTSEGIGLMPTCVYLIKAF